MSDLRVAVGQIVMLGPWRLSRSATQASCNVQGAETDSSCLEDEIDQMAKTGRKVTFQAQGYTRAAQDLRRLAALKSRTLNEPVVLCEESGGPVGSFAVLLPYLQSFTYDLGNQRSAIRSFTTNMVASDDPMGGQVLFNSFGTSGVEPAAAPGPAVNEGALPAGSRLVAIVAASEDPWPVGTDLELTVTLESGVDEPFTGGGVVRATSPVFKLTNPAANELPLPGAWVVELDGDVAAITDTWWRLSAALTGNDNPAVQLFGAIAIATK